MNEETSGVDWGQVLPMVHTANKNALKEQFTDCFGDEFGAAMWESFYSHGRDFAAMSAGDETESQAAVKFIYWFFGS